MRDRCLKSLLLLPLSIFKGRTGNAAYVFFYTLLMAGGAAYRHAVGVLKYEAAGSVPLALFGSLLVLSGAALLIRRMHDVGGSGWWGTGIVALVVLAGLGKLALFFCLIVAVLPGQVGANRFGPSPDGVKGTLLKLRLARLSRGFVHGEISAGDFNARRAALLAK